MAIAPREHTQFSLENSISKFFSNQQQQQQSNQSVNRLKMSKHLLTPIVEQESSKKLLKEIESIKPDHEQRKLAIEVRIHSLI